MKELGQVIKLILLLADPPANINKPMSDVRLTAIEARTHPQPVVNRNSQIRIRGVQSAA